MQFYMKKLFYISVVTFFLGCISSCKQTEQVHVVNGTVYDATMNNIMVITDRGDTLNISTMDADTNKVPGVLLDDSIEVSYVKEKIEGGGEVLKAVELMIFKK